MYKTATNTILILALCLTTLAITACSEKTGTLEIRANGEDFVTEGFISKEGYTIDFDNVLINIGNIKAYNPQDEKLSTTIKVATLIDLKKGTPADPTVAVRKLENVPEGNYQSLRFSLKQIESGEYAGYSIILIGSATKDEKTTPFLIKLNEELTFDGREGYVGDSIKGLVDPGESSDVEMTFHFDHLFGNIEAPADDHVNSGSPGFDFFMTYENNGSIDVNQNQMIENPQYDKLIRALESLGHLGEGHCEVIK